MPNERPEEDEVVGGGHLSDHDLERLHYRNAILVAHPAPDALEECTAYVDRLRVLLIANREHDPSL